MASSYLLGDGLDGQDLRVPPASHRHAAPSGPWPWMDIGSDFTDVGQSSAPPAGDENAPEWEGYPQNLFPNWLPGQVESCRILRDPMVQGESKIYKIDIVTEPPPRGSTFVDGGVMTAQTTRNQDFWENLQMERPLNVATRLLFVHNMTVPVLQMIGTKYNVEPFFFSSSINWIPSRYAESPELNEGDHITITLPFVRAMPNFKARLPVETPRDNQSSTTLGDLEVEKGRFSLEYDDALVIDTQKPLSLRATPSEPPAILAFDQLSLHMIRTSTTNTVVSYHHQPKWKTTGADRLHSVVMLVSRSVYWQKIFERSKEPTFLLLAIMWYPLYAWDKALERLYVHISWLESNVIKTNDMDLVQQLHIIQAHLLHYAALLRDFRESVIFIRDNGHPARHNEAIYTTPEKMESDILMRKESDNLISEIDRLDKARNVQINRLKNVMALAFATVNIEDSKVMRRLTQAAVRDSAAMRQISYLTMVFLPGTFAASIFGMNITELAGSSVTGTVPHYLAVTITLTVLTVWLVIALQGKSPFHEQDRGTSLRRRLLWPYTFIHRRVKTRRSRAPEGILDIARDR